MEVRKTSIDLEEQEVIVQFVDEPDVSCSAFDELRNYLRPRYTAEKALSLTEQRQVFGERLAALQLLTRTAS